MAQYIVSYDLRAPGRNYQSLYGMLKSAGVRILESVWLIQSDMGAAAVRDKLKSVTDQNDGIMVVELEARADWATYNVSLDGSNWLKTKVA